jgi:8-oxo-dGTP pyrophosphatase MutT (NUDIX family)
MRGFVPRELKGQPFSLDEARALGITPSALRGSSWRRIGSRLYQASGAPKDHWALIDAHRRMLPASAVFMGLTAAWMHGLDVEPARPVEVALPKDTHLRRRDGLLIRYPNVTDEVVKIKGIPATSLSRTLLDLSATLTPVEALVAIDMACHANFIDQDALRVYADEVKGRRGAGRLRRLAGHAAPAESPMETRLRWLLIEAGLPVPEVQTDLYDESGHFLGRADLYYPQAQLVIEFDGGNHRDRLVGDNRRQNLLQQAGYTILRFTGPDLYGRPNNVVALVTAALKRQPAA